MHHQPKRINTLSGRVLGKWKRRPDEADEVAGLTPGHEENEASREVSWVSCWKSNW